jgi:hypothetical protein
MPYKWVGKGGLKFNDKDTPKVYVSENCEIPADKVTTELLEKFGDQIVKFEKVIEKPVVEKSKKKGGK